MVENAFKYFESLYMIKNCNDFYQYKFYDHE
jgi:hypothetical protein